MIQATSEDSDAGKLPRRILVAEVLDSRYGPGLRPASWDDRFDGVEHVRTATGEEIYLFSNGGQSSPAPGWELLLTRESPTAGSAAGPAYEWTLYGIKPQPE